MSLKALLSIGTFCVATVLHGQALPAATRVGDFKLGAGFTTLAPDTTPLRFNGVGAYADFDLTHHLGLEGEFHFATNSGGTGEYEATYEIGGRYFRTYGRFIPYAKVLYGRGVYHFTEGIQLHPGAPVTYYVLGNNAYNLIAIGAGTDFRLTHRIYLRGDWEYQRWFQFQDSSLSPSLITVGAAWHF